MPKASVQTWLDALRVSVPANTWRSGRIPRRIPPAVAAGLNIAGFNGGIALGLLLGGASLEAMGLTSTAWVGAIAVGLGFAWMLWQMRRPAFQSVALQG